MTEAPTDLARGRESPGPPTSPTASRTPCAMLTEAQAEHRGHLELNDAPVNALSRTPTTAGRDRETARLPPTGGERSPTRPRPGRLTTPPTARARRASGRSRSSASR